VYLSTPLTTTRLLSQTGPPPAEGYALDITPWADRPLLTGSLVLTAEAVDAAGRRSVSPPVTVGLDRTDPRLTLLTGTGSLILPGSLSLSGTLALSPTLAADDATSGVTHMALGPLDWRWEGETFTRTLSGTLWIGRPTADPDALNGQAMHAAPPDPPGAWTRSGITLPANRPYRAYFRLKVGDIASTAEVVRLEVLIAGEADPIGLRRLRGVDFRAPDAYQEFHVDFDYRSAGTGSFGPPLILRVTFTAAAPLAFDRVIVLDSPIPYQPTLPAGYAGNLRLKFIDAAGNVSPDLLLLPVALPTYPLYLPLVRK